ncbi:hypothetical protein K8352_17530 [Flavobacteriaceae bacterium F89]|uniref:Uncharacterized protein n=1 Tax=Cerina litoralis TaxID=2874477 RepID=A0AAE3EWV2_9FLAO|nr:hypothetical protein [Cerina litoralis]MCG2462567.1 hypothetical protein [Cerina litoralis]
MAYAIKSIPVLSKRAASDFEKKIEANFSNKSTIDFSKQKRIADKILAKAKI